MANEEMKMEEQMPQAPPNPQEGGEQQQGQPQGEGPQLDPEKKKEIEGISNLFMKFLHGPKTRDQVYEVLKAAPPEKSIPQAAMIIVQLTKGNLKKKGVMPSLEVMMGAGMYLVSDLVEIVNAGGFNIEQPIGDEESVAILQDTMQQYIEQGLKDKTVDPIELQALVEPAMNDQQHSVGARIAQEQGIPPAPGQNAAMETYANKRIMQEQGRMQAQFKGAQKKAGGGRQGALAQARPQQGQPQQGGMA